MRTRDERRLLTTKARHKDKVTNALPNADCGCKGMECDWCFFTSRGMPCRYMRNPRKVFGVPSEQEQRAAIGEREQLREHRLL
jgi:hypothetical protein